ncbi:TIGR03668 family PPOX class F420-dependent oxidoreductase [Rhodococcus sp. NPDC058521]|uniref:TIGR03668 family PPOX class F420-dependent oxidoreductase n=1 Tax=Rhodococcus sp. NPDC058521 TaxID=3346536 RepID=UPI0036511EAA
MDGEKLFGVARVARMATTNSDAQPHLVPVVFVLVDGVVYTSVDHKPKRSKHLRRLANIAADARVSVLVDHYEEDWNNLWWVRVDGIAEILEGGEIEAQRAIDALTEKYPQYALIRPDGPVIAVRNLVWRTWSGEGTASMNEELS